MKQWIAVCLTVSILLTLCACGQMEPQDGGTTPSEASTTTTTAGTESATASVTESTAATTGGTTPSAPSGTSATTGNTTTGGTTTTAAKPTTTTTTAVTTTTTTTVTTTTVTTTTTTAATKPTVPLQPGSIEGKDLWVGDRMYDITITDTAGQTVKLSDLLQEKELVVLNYWFVNCSFCIKEFPAMSAAYAAYRDRVAVYAVNPIDRESAVLQFRQNNPDLAFPIASGPYEWAQAFRITGYPTTVVIGKDGIIKKIHTGAIVNESDWTAMFEQYM